MKEIYAHTIVLLVKIKLETLLEIGLENFENKYFFGLLCLLCVWVLHQNHQHNRSLFSGII